MCLCTGYILTICKEAVKKFVILPFKLCFMGMTHHVNIKKSPHQLTKPSIGNKNYLYTTTEGIHVRYLFTITETVKRFVVLPYKLCFVRMIPNHIKELSCELNEGEHDTEPTNHTTFKEMNKNWKPSMWHNSYRIVPNHLCNGYLFIFSDDRGYIGVVIEQIHNIDLQPVEENTLNKDISKELVIGMIGLGGPDEDFTIVI